MSDYRFTDIDGDSLEVSSFDANASVCVEDEDGVRSYVHIPKGEVPATALALLKAGGYEPSNTHPRNPGGDEVHYGAYWLERHVKATEAAAEEADLENEALTLLNAGLTASGMEPLRNVPTAARDYWLGLVRRARTLYATPKEN